MYPKNFGRFAKVPVMAAKRLLDMSLLDIGYSSGANTGGVCGGAPESPVDAGSGSPGGDAGTGTSDAGGSGGADGGVADAGSGPWP